MTDFGFDWDAGNWPKCGRHGLSREAIEFVFRNGPLVAPDDRHAEVEERFIAIGRSPDGRPVFVGFTYRGTAEKPLVRPITARFMHRKEAERYGAQSTRDED